LSTVAPKVTYNVSTILNYSAQSVSEDICKLQVHKRGTVYRQPSAQRSNHFLP